MVNGPVSFPQLGTYYYTVKAINNAGTCEVIKRLTVYVYDQATCGFRYEKYHATNTTDWGTVTLLGIPLGAINDRSKAGDGDLSSFATISNIVSLVGIGTTYQDLKFAAPVTGGTPVTIKIGQNFSLTQVIGGITVIGLDASGNPIGNLQSVGDAALLDLLVGDNVFEYTFTPTATNGSQPAYQGVRVLLGSVLGVANNMNVYGAYINRNVPVQDNGSCTIDPNVVVKGAVIPGNTEATLTLNNTAQDVLWGVEDPGLGVATSLSSVLYPYQAVDNNLDTYAVFNTAVSVLNKQTLTAKFKQVARPGDEVRIIIGSQNIGVLNLNLLADFKIQRYMGNAPVGDLLTNQNFSLVDLNVLGLLGSNPSRKAIIISAIDVPFDRVEISHTKLAAVELLGEYTYIYDVAVVPNLEFDNIINTDGSAAKICVSQPLSIEKLDSCTGYIVSFAHKVTTAGVDSYVDIPGSALTIISDQNGIIKYALTETYSSYGDALYLKIQSTRSECTFGDAQYLKVKIAACNMIANPMIRTRLK